MIDSTSNARARIHTDGRPFIATDAEAALILDLTLAAYGDNHPFNVGDLDHVLAISGCDTHWLAYALNERENCGLLTVSDNSTWRVIDSAALRSRIESTWQASASADHQQREGMSDEKVLNLVLALWADGAPFTPADLEHVLAFTGQSWTWLLARLGERVVSGILGYDTATGYRVINSAALQILALGPQPITTPATITVMPAQPAQQDGGTAQEARHLTVLVPTYTGHTYTVGPDQAEAVLDHALGFFADGAPFTAADLVDVLDVTGQTRTWLWVRLAEKVTDGLLARHIKHATYTVIDAARVRADALAAELALTGQLDEVEQESNLVEPTGDRPVYTLDIPAGRLPLSIHHPVVTGASAPSCPTCSDPAQIRKAARARTAFGLALLALLAAAALLAAPAALTIALIVISTITGIRFFRLAPAPCRHRR